MKKTIKMFLFLVIGVCTLALSDQAAPPVGLEALSSFDHLWVWSPKVKTAMFSSTDPKGGNLDWWSFHGKYRGEPILAKIEGPGCIYRIWSASANGLIRIYIEGNTKPEISCSFKSYLNGKCKGLPDNFAIGRKANYMPIPFAKSIVITAPGFGPSAYYQVSYQTYDSSVKIKSFSKKEAGAGEAFQAAAANWTKSEEPLPGNLVARSEVSGNDEATIEINGTGIIRKLSIMNAEAPQTALKDARLKIIWDRSGKPAVDVPLDAFFINHPDLKDKWPGGSLKNFFIAANKDALTSTFPMPFAGGARILVSAPGQKIKIVALAEKRDSLPPDSMRFHANYKSKEFTPNEKKENIFTYRAPVDPATNYVVLDEKGKGNYLGCALFVKSVGTVWWGEGDEMDYVDGAAKPQIQGTGTEDEFNWSWGFSSYMSPISGTLPVVPACKESIVAQVIPQLRNPECQKIRGDNIAYRFRPSDYVPFEQSIKVSYEILGNSFLAPHAIFSGNLSQERGDNYASIAYWYELPE